MAAASGDNASGGVSWHRRKRQNDKNRNGVAAAAMAYRSVKASWHRRGMA
jgi:hypothetical protein